MIEIISVDMNSGSIQIGFTDADDQTPIIDIKPYHPATEFLFTRLPLRYFVLLIILIYLQITHIINDHTALGGRGNLIPMKIHHYVL